MADLLKCDCEDGGKHVQYVDANGETVVECTECGRFLKFPEPQADVPTKPE